MPSLARREIPGTRRKIWRPRWPARHLPLCCSRGSTIGLFNGSRAMRREARQRRMTEMQAKPKVEIEIVAAAAHEMDAVRELFRENEKSLGISLCFQSFDKELAEPPGQDAPPQGRLLVAK